MSVLAWLDGVWRLGLHTMSGSSRRPLPPEVYLRRRIAAGVILIVIIALVWWAIASLSSSKKADTAASGVTHEAVQPPFAQDTAVQTSAASDKNSEEEKKASPSTSSGDTVTTSVASSENTSTSASASATAEEAKQDTCSVADLRITAKPSKPEYASTELPNFFVSIYNPTKADCLVDFDSARLLFEVFTLNDYKRVWGDLDCNKPEVTGEVKIKAGDTKNYELGAWSRTTSAPNQCEKRQPVAAGGYMLYAHVGDNNSDPATFNLR